MCFLCFKIKWVSLIITNNYVSFPKKFTGSKNTNSKCRIFIEFSGLIWGNTISYAELSFVTLTFFKNLEKWERIENGLNKRFCHQDRRTQKKVLGPKSHVVIKRQNKFRGLRPWVLYFLQWFALPLKMYKS